MKLENHPEGTGEMPVSSHMETQKHTNTFPTGAPRSQASVAELSQKLREGVHTYLNSDKYQELLTVMSRFHHYSLNNSILIALQTGGKATQVASYTTWKALGRSVSKGEKGIRIFSPLPYKQKLDPTMADPSEEVTPSKDKKTRPNEQTISRIGFKVAYVFDISQTSGKPLPEVTSELMGSIEDYEDLQAAVKEACPVCVVYGPIAGNTFGYFSPSEQEVRIREGLSEIQSLKTLIHETAHARLHAAGTDGAAFSRDDKEIQAESVAFIVSAHYGLDTSAYSFPYVANWASGDEKQVMSNLQIIKDASFAIIHSMDQTLERLSLERQTHGVYKYPEGYLSLQKEAEGSWHYERFGTDFLPKVSGSIPQPGLRIDQAASKAGFLLGYTGALQPVDPQDFQYSRSIAHTEENFRHIHR